MLVIHLLVFDWLQAPEIAEPEVKRLLFGRNRGLNIVSTFFFQDEGLLDYKYGSFSS